MKRFWIAIILCLGILAGGAYYSNGLLHHNSVIIAQPAVDFSKEPDKQDEPITNQKEWINILVLGVDNWRDEVARTDLMMLVSANVESNQVSIISIPRDTRVNIQGVGLTKINHANVIGELNGGIHEGTLESAKAVSNLLGITINYYVKINFRGFQKVVDAVGGIDLNLPNSVNDFETINLPAGENHLSGEEALCLAQVRYGLPNGDFDRQQNQYYILSALAHQVLNPSNILKLPEVLNMVQQDLLDTNLTPYEMVTLGLKFKGISREAIKYFQLPGQSLFGPDPLVGMNVYYYVPDMEGVKKVVQEAMRI